ncbi:Holliday junction branch migration protein RuvA [Paenibacillus flagellatus]|uniref:Holliday junction branch migration complex subunit RuvA n=1 Tax=Paenibacillus flagellatus TaxID=2211139 RepID=A0A2V5KQ08_9BACL|nr:Holliday junction branch migration protein RuvA [Paenibacillus flagellatus]PYI53307.1 Holliday junction branch migration protein RuvA [Paenibacillus flagellatus]
MIDFLRGKVAHREPEYVVMDVHGVGYRVFCPNPYAFSDKPEDVTVYIHHHVREDAILLFGFASREEQALFRKLIDVTGIGPKVALGILSGGRPESVVAAIQQENVAFLTKLPGIGKKTAQRIILDLKDKLGAVTSGFDGAAFAGALQEAGAAARTGSGPWAEAKEALLALGYTEAEADRAWSSVKAKAKENDSADVLVKLALQALYAG